MIKDKLRKLRISKNMTQQEVSEKLGVSSQTVSKWERGILSPDISLLPQIAVLFQCTIDSLFDMDSAITTERKNKFFKRLKETRENEDWENEYKIWIDHIKANPDEFVNYGAFLNRIYEKRKFDRHAMEQAEILANRANKLCEDINILNMINYAMVHLCAESGIEYYKNQTEYYYKKLPFLRHGRDRLVKYIMEGEKLRRSEMYTVKLLYEQLNSAICDLAEHEGDYEEKMYFYKKAADICEVILEDKYGGYYDIDLLDNYYQMALHYAAVGKIDDAKCCTDRILEILERHLDENKRKDSAKILYEPLNLVSRTTIKRAADLLSCMVQKEEFSQFKNEISAFEKRYRKYFKEKCL